MDDDGKAVGGFADAASARARLLERERAEGKARPQDEAERTSGRGRGRPKGSFNRKTKEFERWYEAQGYRDPLDLMGEFISQDPIELQAWFIAHERAVKAVGKGFFQAIPSLTDILYAQQGVAKELAPYLHGKKPVQVEIVDERLPKLIINLGTDQLAQGHALAAMKALSAGQPMIEAIANEINELDVRGKDASSHDADE